MRSRAGMIDLELTSNETCSGSPTLCGPASGIQYIWRMVR